MGDDEPYVITESNLLVTCSSRKEQPTQFGRVEVWRYSISFGLSVAVYFV